MLDVPVPVLTFDTFAQRTAGRGCGAAAGHLRKMSTWAANTSGWSSMMRWNEPSMRTIGLLPVRFPAGYSGPGTDSQRTILYRRPGNVPVRVAFPPAAGFQVKTTRLSAPDSKSNVRSEEHTSELQ